MPVVRASCTVLAALLLAAAAEARAGGLPRLRAGAPAGPSTPRSPRPPTRLPASSGIDPDAVPLDAATLERLAGIAEGYRAQALEFTCRETTRRARYDDEGRAGREQVRRSSYLLAPGDGRQGLVELRRKPRQQRASAWKAAEPGLPATYDWLLLFERRRQPAFFFSDLGAVDADGVPTREIGFRGALGWERGAGLAEWEGTVLLDVASGATLEVRAEPVQQPERLEQSYRRWQKALRVKVGLATPPDPLGLPGSMPEIAGVTVRAVPPPIGHRFRGVYGYPRNGLTLPTRGRYEVVRAVGPREVAIASAEIRLYDEYRFYRTDSETSSPEDARRDLD